jgi:hypothetical protein
MKRAKKLTSVAVVRLPVALCRPRCQRAGPSSSHGFGHSFVAAGVHQRGRTLEGGGRLGGGGDAVLVDEMWRARHREPHGDNLLLGKDEAEPGFAGVVLSSTG